VSPSTEHLDRGQKLRIYATQGVPHAWFVDPLRQSLEVLAFESGILVQTEGHHCHSTVRARPFDAVELELRALWI
jgi:Uma2 family endonuclease